VVERSGQVLGWRRSVEEIQWRKLELLEDTTQTATNKRIINSKNYQIFLAISFILFL